MRKIVLLGAPSCSSLNWDESTLLPRDPSIPNALDSTLLELKEVNGVQWRQLRWDTSHLKTGFSDQSPQSSVLETDDIIAITQKRSHTDFTTLGILTELFHSEESSSEISTTTSSAAETDAMLSQFCDESFIADTGDSSSQISDLDPAPNGIPALAQAGAREHYEATLKSNSKSIRVGPRLTHTLLKDLASVPSASYLRSIQPQTMTVNVVVGIIALPPAVTVIAGRRWGRGREVDLVEMLVGDDSKSAFGFSVWLAHAEEINHATSETDSLRISLSKLQRGDVILIQSMALGTFRGKVHGQSLRRSTTKIELLYRRGWGNGSIAEVFDTTNWADESAEEEDRQAREILTKKVGRVSQWILDFVGEVAYEDEPSGGRVLGRGAAGKSYRRLPPDTQ